MGSSPIPRLMLVTDRRDTDGRDLVAVVEAAVAGGVDTVQVREKDLADDELLALTESVQVAVAGRAKVLVNGRPSVARRLGVGLHLPGDRPAPTDRGWLLWGRSIHSAGEGLCRAREGPDYLLVGPVFPTDSKPGHPGGGLSLVKETVDAAAPCPVLGIGGIDAGNAGAVIEAGAVGVAVRGALLRARDPEGVARSIVGSLSAG